MAIADHKKMLATAESLREHYEKAVAEDAQEQQRTREVRQHYAQSRRRKPQVESKIRHRNRRKGRVR